MAWLGVGGIRVWWFGPDGLWHLVDTKYFANTAVTGGFCKSNRTMRWEVRNTSGAAVSMGTVCADVRIEGDEVLESRAIGVPPLATTTSCSSTASIYPVIGVRMTAAGITSGEHFDILGWEHINTSNQACKLYLLRNPTLSGAITWTQVAGAEAEYGLNTAGTVTVSALNEVIWAGSCSGNQNIRVYEELVQSIGATIDGTSDTYILCAQPYASNLNCHSSFNIAN
jgi:hypothetical protein